jgi:preprotein translocase subunit Sec63
MEVQVLRFLMHANTIFIFTIYLLQLGIIMPAWAHSRFHSLGVLTALERQSDIRISHVKKSFYKEYSINVNN